MAEKFGKLKALVVEDSKVAIKAITGYLEEIGVHPMIAETGSAAVELYRKEHPDIILLDIILPDIDGYEVARRLRASTKTELAYTPIVAVTANAMKDDAQKALNAGCNAYMSKPINIQTLLEQVRQLTHKEARGTTE